MVNDNDPSSPAAAVSSQAPPSPALSTASEASTGSSASDSDVPSRGRKHMRRFLEDLLEGGEVEGLEWCDRENKVFRLPWKHAKKSNYDAEKDGKIFKLWALNTGKHRDGDKPDPTTWKINFRCALNSLRETISEELDAPVNDDFRIFRFVDRPRVPRVAFDFGGAAVQDRFPEHQLPPYILLKRGCPWAYESEFDRSPASAGHGYGEQPAKMPFLNDPRFAGFPTSSPDDLLNLQASFSAGGTQGQESTLGENPSPPMSKGNTSHISEMVDISSEYDSSFPGAAGDTGMKSHGQAMQIQAPPAHPAAAAASKPLVSTEMYVKVSYRSSPVAGMRVTHPQGCRIFWGAPPPQGMPMQTQESLFGPRTLMQLSLPHPHEAQALLPSMWAVLDAMHRGLVVEMHNNDIYATRLCRAAIFWGPPAHDGVINKLERCKRTRIFSYQSFLQTYDSYQHPQRTNIACYPPAYEVVLGVAQPWGRDRLRDNNLLTITLVHSLAEKLIESLHRQRWQQNAPFDSDYLDIDTLTAEDELASNATKHMVKAGRPSSATASASGLATNSSDEMPLGGSMQHPAHAAMSAGSQRPARHQAKQTKQPPRTQQQQHQAASAILQSSMVNAAASHSGLQTLPLM